jgi:hypothetical protein
MTVDIRRRGDEVVRLPSAGYYRLIVEPAEEIYLYVFQVSPSVRLFALFPGDTHSPDWRPLARDREFYIPPTPNWVYLPRRIGRGRIYFLLSREPLHDIADLYEAFRSETTPARQRSDLFRDLLESLEVIVRGNRQDASGFTLTFQHPWPPDSH